MGNVDIVLKEDLIMEKYYVKQFELDVDQYYHDYRDDCGSVL